MNDAFQRLEDRWAAAVANNDRRAAAELLDDDFLLSSKGGVSSSMTKEAWLAALPEIRTASLTATVTEVRVFGEVAVVSATLEWEAHLGERDLSGNYAVTDVFTRRDGDWKASWRVSTRLPRASQLL